jgi:hypothetical protein
MGGIRQLITGRGWTMNLGGPGSSVMGDPQVTMVSILRWSNDLDSWMIWGYHHFRNALYM